MHQRHISRFLSKTALLAMLVATSGCEEIGDTYDSMMGDDTAIEAPKVSVRTPAAAPVQGVNAQEIDSSGATELGSMRDNSLDGTTPDGTPRIIPQAPQDQQQTFSSAPQVSASAPLAQQTYDNGELFIESSAAADVAAAPVLTRTSDAAAPLIAPTPIAANSVALLTIRFNQPHVNYDDALTSAVKQAETVKPGVSYDVLSTMPDLSSLAPDQQQKLASRGKDNLRNVAVKLQQLGVQAERIRIAEQTLKIRSQEIQIYVR
jgi:hypothetical protein